MTTNQSEPWFCASASGAYRAHCDGCQADRWHRYSGETTELGHRYQCVECWCTTIEPLQTTEGDAHA